MNGIGRALALVAALATLACGSDEPVSQTDAGAAEVVQPAAAAAPAVEPTGTVIEVKMVTDGEGNYFEPAEITAQRGDVLRFVLVSGVHNVSFPADRNPGKAGLPEAGPYLQLPGQTYDYTVGLNAGEYEFVCDPHAALGMIGTLTVEG